MDITIDHRPSYAMAHIQMDPGDRLQAETATMITMSETIIMDTSLRGGLFSALRRSKLGGSTFFLNTFRARSEGELNLAPHMPGDIELLELQGDPVYVQSGSFLAATMDVKVDTQWGGARTFFSSEGLFLLRCTGTGTLLVSSYGAIHRIDLAPGQNYTVDNGHMVAFDSSVNYSLGKAGGWKTTLLGGEGLVCKLRGPGRFYVQTRSEDTFLDWLAPKLGSKFKKK